MFGEPFNIEVKLDEKVPMGSVSVSSYDLNYRNFKLAESNIRLPFRKMLDLGMLIDITHCTPTGRKEGYNIVDEVGATECLLASHMGCYELNRDPMNLEDWEIKWFADHGCVLGVIHMGYWLSPVDTGMALKHIEQTVHHIQKVAGDDVAGIGTDLDGFTDPPDEIVSIDEMPRLTKYMAATNHYTEEQLEKFLGKNSMRLLLNGWKKE